MRCGVGWCLRVGIVAAVIGLGACQPAQPTPTATSTPVPVLSPSPPGSTTAAPETPAAEQVDVFDLAAGDCFSDDDEVLSGSITVVRCDEPHLYEAYAVVEHPGGPDEAYPGDDVIRDDADTACQPAFEAFVGIAYAESVWYITSVTPSAETWAAGDREIVCTLNRLDANDEPIEVTGSAEGAAE
jgi:hypothetical protein